MNDEIVYVNQHGKRSKKPPKGVPPFKPKPVLNGGISPENGESVRPNLDWRLRKKHGKSKKI